MEQLKKVNVFCGRFQPFHKGHLKCCEDAYKKNGYPVYIFYTPNTQFDKRKPFDDRLLEKEYSILSKHYDYIEGYDWMKVPQPVRMCRVLKEKGYEAVLWLAGEDRIDNYRSLLNDKAKDMITNELEVNVPEIFETERYGSATAVREALKADDKAKYLELMPKYTEGLYDEFKAQLDKVYESSMSLVSFIESKNIRSINEYITEGGHSVDNAEPIRGDLAKPIADKIIRLVRSKFGCEMDALGSVGKKGSDKMSGDIDIAIEYDWDKREDIIEFCKKEFNCPIGNINDKLHVFNIGYTYDMDGQEKMVQVDFMFTDNVEFAKFAYNSPDFTKNESKYKGMYQSALLMAIVENTPIEDVLGKDYVPQYFDKGDYDGSYDGQVRSYWKLYFDQNDGLKAEHKSFDGKTKPLKNASTVKGDTIYITKDINKILNLVLGKDADKDTCKTFENELSYIMSDKYKYRSKEQLEKIKDTFLNDWQLKMKTDPSLMKEFEDLFDKNIEEL